MKQLLEAKHVFIDETPIEKECENPDCSKTFNTKSCYSRVYCSNSCAKRHRNGQSELIFSGQMPEVITTTIISY